MRVRPIHFVEDLERAQRFDQGARARDRASPRGRGPGSSCARAAAISRRTTPPRPRGEGRSGIVFSFVAEEPLELVARRLRDAGFPPEGEAVDQEWDGRCSCAGPTG